MCVAEVYSGGQEVCSGLWCVEVCSGGVQWRCVVEVVCSGCTPLTPPQWRAAWRCQTSC